MKQVCWEKKKKVRKFLKKKKKLEIVLPIDYYYSPIEGESPQ